MWCCNGCHQRCCCVLKSDMLQVYAVVVVVIRVPVDYVCRVYYSAKQGANAVHT